MSQSRERVLAFLASMSSAQPPSIVQMLRLLDELALAYHEAPDGIEADPAVVPPGFDHAAVYRRIGKRFPDLGEYYTVDDAADPPAILSGNAIDDLSDLTIDMMTFAWRFDHVGPEDAHWNLRFDFRVHWGLHLRELALYLHKKAFDA